nr:3355_t:CDS:2 [Entrophospora candida]
MEFLNTNKKAENNGTLLDTFKDETPSNENEETNKKPENEEVRIITVLLFGRKRSGKTTLANVINNINNMKAIDTMGFGDRRLTPQEILRKFAENIDYDDIKDGFNQILFVTNGRFREEEIEAYDLLEVIFVRTNFPDFEDDIECEQDRLDMIKENDKLSTIIKECKKVIHVDNPPITRRTKEGAEETRKESRKKILNHLNICGKIHYPPNLVELNDRIKEYMTGIEKLENELEDLKRQMVVVYNPSTSSGISEENNKNKYQIAFTQLKEKFYYYISSMNPY